MQGLDEEEYYSHRSIGTAQSALEDAQEYMNQREQFGKMSFKPSIK